jgi:hypothetical protein
MFENNSGQKEKPLAGLSYSIALSLNIDNNNKYEKYGRHGGSSIMPYIIMVNG